MNADAVLLSHDVCTAMLLTKKCGLDRTHKQSSRPYLFKSSQGFKRICRCLLLRVTAPRLEPDVRPSARPSRSTGGSRAGAHDAAGPGAPELTGRAGQLLHPEPEMFRTRVRVRGTAAARPRCARPSRPRPPRAAPSRIRRELRADRVCPSRPAPWRADADQAQGASGRHLQSRIGGLDYDSDRACSAEPGSTGASGCPTCSALRPGVLSRCASYRAQTSGHGTLNPNLARVHLALGPRPTTGLRLGSVSQSSRITEPEDAAGHLLSRHDSDGRLGRGRWARHLSRQSRGHRRPAMHYRLVGHGSATARRRWPRGRTGGG
jgi:hypothetical protein